MQAEKPIGRVAEQPNRLSVAQGTEIEAYRE